jgi:hypothetical protein
MAEGLPPARLAPRCAGATARPRPGRSRERHPHATRCTSHNHTPVVTLHAHYSYYTGRLRNGCDIYGSTSLASPPPGPADATVKDCSSCPGRPRTGGGAVTRDREGEQREQRVRETERDASVCPAVIGVHLVLDPEGPPLAPGTNIKCTLKGPSRRRVPPANKIWLRDVASFCCRQLAGSLAKFQRKRSMT